MKTLTRRGALAALATVAVPATSFAQSRARVSGMNLTIVYVGAKDCGPCQVFKHQDFPQWARSGFPTIVRFVEIDAPTTSTAYQARHWPSDLRFLLREIKVPIVPNFILLDGRTIVKIGTGVGGWRNQVLPMIPGMLNGEWFRGYQRLG
jgi:hypothetical protein